MKIERFRIEKLHNYKSYELEFSDNRLIMVSGNGSGKTTIVNIFYYFLSRQWNKLLEFNFEKIVVSINNEQIAFTKDIFHNLLNKNSKIRQRYSANVVARLNDIMENIPPSELLNLTSKNIEILSHSYGVPSHILRDYIFEIFEKKESIDKHQNVKFIESKLNEILDDTYIIYLPTYRRIEKDLSIIFPHLEQNLKEFDYLNTKNESLRNKHNYLELVEFGMKDVSKKIERRCLELRNHFYDKLNTNLIGSYLDDILNKSYLNFDLNKIQQIDSEALDYILKRLDDTVISADGKEKLKLFVEDLKYSNLSSNEDKINAHFVWKLFQIYDFQQKEESDIIALIDVCNDYIQNDKFIYYNKDDFKVEIKLLRELKVRKSFNENIHNIQKINDGNQNSGIEFKDLSSGEKQIVSLFTHLILSQKNYFIIIDEPELSLSVPWQERLLSDILSLDKCKGLLAVTHSPFIFQQNNLRAITHSLEEFTF